MINKALALILVFSLAFNIAFVGIYVHNRVERARPRPFARRPVQPAGTAQGGGWRQFGLKGEQERRVLEDWRETGRKISAIDAEARELRARLIGLLQADTLDEPAIRATRDKLEEDQQKVRDLVFNRMLKLRQELTPEQRRRWVEMMLRTAQARGGVKARPAGQRNAHPGVQSTGPRGRGPGPHGPAATPRTGAEQRPEGDQP